jgi:NADH:ubiquinone oxidoreductase subunit E
MTTETQTLDIKGLVATAIQKHGSHRDAIIPILNEINLAYGYIPSETFKEVRMQLFSSDNQVVVSEGQLYSVASFYHMFSTHPLGKHVARFCESAPCHVMGGRQLFQALKDELGLEPGETTQDNKWSFITTSCLGICGVGPVLLIDEDVYGNVAPEQVRGILARYE